MAKKQKAKKKVAATAKKKPKMRKPAARPKKTAKPKRKVASAKKPGGVAPGETARLREEVRRWQELHAQLQEQIKVKDSTIALQMQQIMELKKNLESLTSPAS
jgi:hypothetical protein